MKITKERKRKIPRPTEFEAVKKYLRKQQSVRNWGLISKSQEQEITMHTIEIDESIVNDNLQIDAKVSPNKLIDVVMLLSPYCEKGFKVKTMFYKVNKGIFNATLTYN